ncbi:MAG: agglutinin biogenesis protein MshP [Pseudomonadota bacterium]
MKRHLQTLARLRRSAGVSIVTAIFLLVVLSALGAAIMTISTSQQASSALDLLGARAYEAARSGAEYGLYQQRRNSVCTTTTFTPGGTLSAFTVTVVCTVTATAGMGAALNQMQITATACNIPASGICPNASTTSPDYVQRVVTVQFY